MKHAACCPECGWTLEFVRDPTYPEIDEWVGRCYNLDCSKYHQRRAPSELGWTEAKALELRG